MFERYPKDCRKFAVGRINTRVLLGLSSIVTKILTIWHVLYSDRSLVLRNLTWGRADVTAGRPLQESKGKCKCFAAFSLRTKNLTLDYR